MDPFLYSAFNIVLVVVNVGLFIWNRSYSSKIRRIALKDDFWFRTIALPMLLDPLQEFSIKQVVALRKIVNSTEENVYDEFNDQFNAELSNLMDRCYVINSQSHVLYQDLVNELQKMEDLVTEYCQTKGESDRSVANQFIHIYTDIISLIMKFHDKNKFI